MVDPSVVALSARVATIVFGTIILASCILQFARADCQAQNSGDGTCKTCGATIGGVNYCSECNGATYAPVNGVCKDVSQSTPGNTFCTKGSSGTCSACKGASFMFKGGCYEKGKGPGNLICTGAASDAAAGICQACADGYYKASSPVATADSCLACQDANCARCGEAGQSKCTKCAEGYFVGAANSDPGACIKCDAGTSGSWAGVTGCAKCTKPAAPGTVTCDECTTDYLKTDTTGSAPITTCVTADKCGEGFFATTANNIKKCVSCGDATNGLDGCEKCTAPGEGKAKPTCTKCKDPNYLKTAADGTTTCVEKDACKDDFFPKEDNSKGNKCFSCGDTDAGIPNCTKCTQPSAAGTAKCTACTSGFKLEGGACVSASTNKSALSAGAIAGISVAAVVVVGGLVGFLCWWFVYRGKA